MTLNFFRTSFLIYDLIHAIVHKAKLYKRLGELFFGDGQSATTSEKIYTISLFMIAILLILMIVFTFLYNYLLVHENLYGITTMAILLALVLVYNVITFGQNSKVESSIICAASAGEISGLVYLLTLIKHKKEIRKVQQAERRRLSSASKNRQSTKRKTSKNAPQSPQSETSVTGGQMHHRRHHYSSGLSISPPSILISATEDNLESSDGQIEEVDEETENKKSQTKYCEQTDSETKSFNKTEDEDKQFGSLLSVVQQLSDLKTPSTSKHRHRRAHRNKKMSRSKLSLPALITDDYSEESDEPTRHRQKNHRHSPQQKHRQDLSVPEFGTNNQDNDYLQKDSCHFRKPHQYLSTESIAFDKMEQNQRKLQQTLQNDYYKSRTTKLEPTDQHLQQQISLTYPQQQHLQQSLDHYYYTDDNQQQQMMTKYYNDNNNNNAPVQDYYYYYNDHNDNR